ncbi:Boundary element-associated factor of 32kD [Carabus blaptoides fortunei]
MSLKLKRKDTSEVWRHFTKKAGNFNIATCKYCASDISRGGKNAVHKGFTTSNMWAHVKRFHLDEIKKCDEGNIGDAGLSKTLTQSTIPKIFSNYSVCDIKHPYAKEITQLIAEEI